MNRRSERLCRLEWLLLGMVLVILGAYLGFSIHEERIELQARESDRLQVQAGVIDENLARHLEGVKLALTGVRDELRQGGDEREWPTTSRRLTILSDAMPGVRTLVVLDAEGTIRASNRAELIGQDFSRRDYFTTPRERPDPAVLYVSPPFTTVLGVFSIAVTHSIAGANGEFAGVVCAVLDPEYFNILLRSVLFAPDMRTVLAHGDGMAFLFMPANPRGAGGSLATPGSFFSRHRDSGQSATLLTGASVVSAGERLMASRTVSRADLPLDKPITIHVSRELSAIHAHWRKASLLHGAIYGAAALAASVGLYFIQRRRRTFEALAAAFEQRQREDAERLRMATQAAGLGVWEYDFGKQRSTWDKAVFDLHGIDPAGVTSKYRAWQDAVFPEDLAEADTALQASMSTGGQAEATYRVRTSDGELRVIRALARTHLDADGRPFKSVGICEDITERERKEREYHTIIQASIDGFWITDFSGRILDANGSICRMLGYPREELLSMSIRDIDAQESPEEIMARTGEIIRTGSARFQARHRRNDGGIIDVEVSALYVATLGERLFTFVRDITERMRLEKALHAQTERLLIGQRTAGMIVMEWDVVRDELNWSDSPEWLRGPKPESGKYPRYLEQVHPEDRDRFRAVRAEGIHTLQPHNDEYRVVRTDGQEVWVHSERLVLPGPDGKAARMLVSLRNITERRRAEQAHARLEMQLRESQKMEALGTLAGGIAHDFNNIVAAIIGNAELARQDVGPSHPALESLEEIRKASRRAKELVQQILAFGRRQVFERKVIALAPVVEESVRLLRATLPAGVELNVRCAVDAPLVLADATQIEQVLLNLCSNAWHAVQSQDRSGAIEVRLAAHETQSGRFACLTVRDNGVGMDEATRGRIFEPFFTTKPAGEGTGLGLSVVHGIVQEHEASIDVESVPGQGTAFRVRFPAAAPPMPAQSAPAPAAAPPPGQGRHLLYVDDDDAIVFLMKRMLERQGYRVSGYTDPREALAAVGAAPCRFDLVVTDYNMPGMSGLDVARALREIRADLPVALASGYITEELRAAAPGAGVRELIYKPDTVDAFCESVTRLVNARSEKGRSA